MFSKNSYGFCRYQSKVLWALALAFFTWFSTQAPITPTLSLFVNGRVCTTTAPVPVTEDLTGNGSTGSNTVYEHLATHHRRKEHQPKVVTFASGYPRFSVDASPKSVASVSAVNSRPSGRVLLLNSCILRT